MMVSLNTLAQRPAIDVYDTKITSRSSATSHYGTSAKDTSITDAPDTIIIATVTLTTTEIIVSRMWFFLSNLKLLNSGYDLT